MDSKMKNKDQTQKGCAKKTSNCINALEDILHTFTYFEINKHDLRIASRMVDRMQSLITDIEDILSFSKDRN